MPTYEYYCPHCKQDTEIVRSMVEYKPIEICVCGQLMYRKYSVPNVSCKVSNYSNALGVDLSDKNAVREMKIKYNDMTGGSLVEVGNENIKNIKRKSVDYKDAVNRAYQEIGAN